MKENTFKIDASTLGMIGVGAATGAIAGSAALVIYAALASKGFITSLAAQKAFGGFVLPGSTGALAGGGTAYGLMYQKINKADARLSEQISEHNGQLEALQQKNTEATTQIENLKKEILNPSPRLEDIRGIGPKFAKKLQQSGIYNIHDLADKNADELKAALGTNSGSEKMFNVDSWINQARELRK